MKYWPGTKIIKSQGNAFDWRSEVSRITGTREFKLSQSSTINMAGAGSDPKKTFTIYSKAHRSK